MALFYRRSAGIPLIKVGEVGCIWPPYRLAAWVRGAFWVAWLALECFERAWNLFTLSDPIHSLNRNANETYFRIAEKS
jgi:hypothetical protein